MPSKLSGARGRRVQLNLPDGSGLEELEKARAEFDRLGKERRRTEERLRVLVTSRAEARTADLSSAALAIRSGKKAPTVRQVDAVDEEIAKLEEYLAAVDTAIDMCETELVTAVELLSDQRVAELDAQLAEAQAAWREQTRALEAQLEKINTIGSLRNWYRDFPGKFPSFRQRTFGHLEMRDGTGSPATVLRALHGAFDPIEDRHVMPVPPDGPTPLPNRNAANVA